MTHCYTSRDKKDDNLSKKIHLNCKNKSYGCLNKDFLKLKQEYLH